MWRAAVQKPLRTGFEVCEEEAEGASGVCSRDPALREWGWCRSELAWEQGEVSQQMAPLGNQPWGGKDSQNRGQCASVPVWPRKRPNLLKKKEKKNNHLRSALWRESIAWGKRIGMETELLQGLLMERSEVKVTQLCLTFCDPMDYTVHGILQARTLEWVAFPFSRGSSQTRGQTQV